MSSKYDMVLLLLVDMFCPSAYYGIIVSLTLSKAINKHKTIILSDVVDHVVM